MEACVRQQHQQTQGDSLMQFLNKVVSHIRAAVNYRCERIATNVPLRMKVGRFGIWLVKVGRVLQLRYANWNGEFRLEHEYPDSDPDICALHVSNVVTEKSILTFDSSDSQPKEITPMVQALFNIRGVTRVVLQPYKIWVSKARVFSWQEILPDAERVVLEHLAIP
jgi:hypothetical protein